MSAYDGDPSEYKVYWFSRDLVASAYGSYATKETEHLRSIAHGIEARLNDEASVDEIRNYVEVAIPEPVSETYGGDISKRYRQTEDLTERVVRRIEDREDAYELHIAAEAVVRVSEILSNAPSFGPDEIREIVDESLVVNGELDPSLAYDALFNVDFDGEAYQLGAQRQPLVEYVEGLMQELEESRRMDSEEVSRVISSVVQEYERRAGQSRASTAGNVLETGLQYIFQKFGIPATGNPEHFGDLEIDNMVEGPDGSVGFSCKRTLRERFRQSLSRQSEVGVGEIWFVSLMMADVSREKIEDIANDGGRLYVPRDSFVWSRYGEEDDLAYHLRPADEFIHDISDYTGIELDPVLAN
jgi:hypothetical protein